MGWGGKIKDCNLWKSELKDHPCLAGIFHDSSDIPTAWTWEVFCLPYRGSPSAEELGGAVVHPLCVWDPHGDLEPKLLPSCLAPQLGSCCDSLSRGVSVHIFWNRQQIHGETVSTFCPFQLKEKRKSNQVSGTDWKAKASWLLPLRNGLISNRSN